MQGTCEFFLSHVGHREKETMEAAAFQEVVNRGVPCAH